MSSDIKTIDVYLLPQKIKEYKAHHLHTAHHLECNVIFSPNLQLMRCAQASPKESQHKLMLRSNSQCSCCPRTTSDSTGPCDPRERLCGCPQRVLLPSHNTDSPKLRLATRSAAFTGPATALGELGFTVSSLSCQPPKAASVLPVRGSIGSLKQMLR